MLYREIIAVCSQIHTKHKNKLFGQNVELLNVKLTVHIMSTVQALAKSCIYLSGSSTLHGQSLDNINSTVVPQTIAAGQADISDPLWYHLLLPLSLAWHNPTPKSTPQGACSAPITLLIRERPTAGYLPVATGRLKAPSRHCASTDTAQC